MDKAQKVYEDFEVPDPGRIEKVQKFIVNSTKRVNIGRKYRLLEFGACKNSLVSRFAGLDTFSCYAVDINPREMANVKFFLADANNGFPDTGVNGFDYIFAGEFIEHLYDDKKFALECYENLNPGGYLILTVPNLHYLLNRILIPFGKIPYFSIAQGHYHVYTRSIITDLLEKTGFTVEKLISSHVLFPARTNAVNLPAFLMRTLGAVFEFLGDCFPSFGGHLIIFSRK